jgi:hypothetical protein
MPDRPMTPELTDALAGLTAVERKILRHYAKPNAGGEDDFSPWLHTLLVGLDAEVSRMERHEVVEKIRGDMVLHAHEVDHLADVDKAAEGATWPTEPEDRSKGVAWFPWAVPDTIEGLDTPCA